jgi:CPA1 family monovalent cation:H+ antiporter
VLQLEDDGEVDREVRLARAETARAALDAVDGSGSGEEMVQLLRRKYQERLQRAEERVAAPGENGESAYLTAQRRAQAAQRRRLSELRATGVIGDDAFHRVEEELDWADVNVDAMARSE